MNSKENMGERLRIALLSRGKTQRDLQVLLGVSSATTSDWCRGKKFMRIEHLEKVCEYLHISASELLGF